MGAQTLQRKIFYVAKHTVYLPTYAHKPLYTQRKAKPKNPKFEPRFTNSNIDHRNSCKERLFAGLELVLRILV